MVIIVKTFNRAPYILLSDDNNIMTKILSYILLPFRWLGKVVTFFRNLILNLLFILFILIVAASLFFEKKISVKNNSALVLTISGNVVEEKKELDPLGEFFNEQLGMEEFPSEILLQDILDVINHGATDKKISCMVLDLKKMNHVGLNQLNVIGDALQKFKSSGKQIIAADDSYSQKQYYLASYANKIFLNPAGKVQITGFGLYRLYFREALEKLKINFHVFRVGEYKSAVEVLTRDTMSSQDRQQSRIWLASLWDSYTSHVTTQRSLPSKSLDNFANNISTKLAVTDGDSARLALESGLIDEIKNRSEIRSYIATLSAPDSVDDYRKVSFRNYLKSIKRSYQKDDTVKDKIGIIVASGNILDGRRPVGIIGGDSLSDLIRRARRDQSIKAVVLRINSGGGSVFASEIIRQEILDLKNSGKPIIISMGSMAASGGYWISADADEIWASPVTITGSIGIFGALPTFENSLADMGIQSDGVGTTTIASANNMTRPLSPILKETIQLQVNHGYNRFLTIVSQGRKIDKSSLDQIAQGRIFTGKKALELGLVDKLGTLQDAIKSAAEKAALKEYSPQYVSKSSSLKEKLLNSLSIQIVSFLKVEHLPPSFLKTVYQIFVGKKPGIIFNDPNGLYAHCMINDF